jgi:acyl-CoA reductase-like NAD-dependent aldehyde dehydrogenase
VEASPLAHEYALLEELSFVRREAQAEADLAYADWSQRPADRLAFAVYQAAQERADAAQDDLAQLAQELAGVTA